MASSILLETGTGELEILHFTVNGEHYAINVIKVRELLEIKNLSKIPNSHAAVAGICLNRDEMITVVDLQYVLMGQHSDKVENGMTLVCEFNQLKVAFSIEAVIGTHKIPWAQIIKPDSISENSLVIGNIQLNDGIIMMLDFEKIIMDINPATGITADMADEIETKDRSMHKIMIADDSPMIRKVLFDTLSKAGFRDMTFFNDGQEALDRLTELQEKKGRGFLEDVDLLITDIEMPRLDGHALTKRIKEHRDLKELPVVIFSSLITDSLRHKGESVGADAQMSKPQIGSLVSSIDSILS